MSVKKINALNFLSKYPIILSVIISLIVLAIYSGVLTADFVMWEDDIFIYKNPNLGKLSLDRIYWAFTDVDLMMRYNPLTLISWCFTYHFWGLNPFGYHLVNWLLHGLNAGLLFLIIRKILLLSIANQNNVQSVHRNINIAALLATLFWALHPLRVEPVAWATDRTYCQAIFFLLLSTLFYIEAVVLEADKKCYIFFIISAFIFYTISLFSYAFGITYFAVFFILDIFLFKRVGGSIGWWKSRTVKKVLFEKLIFGLPAVLVGTITVIVIFNYNGLIWEPPVKLQDFGLFERVMQAMYILSYVIWRSFYPVNLAPIYTALVSFDPLAKPFLLSAFSVIVISVILFIFRKRWPLIFALWLSYIILSIPFMGFFEHPHFHCDRYSLVPSICLSILIAFALINLMKNKKISVISVSVLLIVICILSWVSFNQIKIWNNSETLFSHMIKTLGNDPYRQDIYCRLGAYLYEKGKKEKAIINFEKTLEINPFHPLANIYMTKIEYKNNNLTKVKYHLQNLLITLPYNSATHSRISEIIDKLNKNEKSAYH